MTNTIMHGIPQVNDLKHIVVCNHYHTIFTDFDMNVLQERLKEQKRKREKAALNKTPPSQRKDQYTPIEIDTGSDELKKCDSTTDSESSGDGAIRRTAKKQPLPTSAKPNKSQSSSTSESETTPKRKPLPPPPAKKPIEPPTTRSKPASKREDASVASTPNQSLIDRMNQPLPPTPGEEPQSSSNNARSDGGRFKLPKDTAQAPQPTGSALLKEMMAKRGKATSDGANPKKKQPVPVPKQRPSGKKNTPSADSSKPPPNVLPTSSLTPEQLHEPAGYANLPVHDTPYQNMGFGPDADVQPQEQDSLYENVHQRTSNTKQKTGKTDSAGAHAKKTIGYVNVRMNGSGTGSSGGSEYQNINATRRPRP